MNTQTNPDANIPPEPTQEQIIGKTVTLILNHQRAQDLPGRISIAPQAVVMIAGMRDQMLVSQADELPLATAALGALEGAPGWPPECNRITELLHYSILRN